MRLFMIGTPTCTKCKSMRPRVEHYCRENNIEFIYKDLQEVSKDIVDYLVAQSVKSAPAFLIYKDGDIKPVVVTGDDLFVTLES